MVEYTIHSCPKCNCFTDLVVNGISSGIGPSSGICGKCGNKINTGRKEYDAMNWKEKLRFYAASALYVVFVGFMGGLCTYGEYKFLTEGANAKGLEIGFNLFLLVSLWAASVVIIQFLRIKESKKRFSSGSRSSEIRYPSLDFGLQITYCALIIVPFMLAGLIAYLRS